MNMRADIDVAVLRGELAKLASVVAETPTGEGVFHAAADAAGSLIGHKLFTIMAFDADAMEVQRLYSDNVQAYPKGGRKKKRDTAWGRQVLEEGKPYIGYSADDIRTHFNDHKLIIGLGLESVLNMPIRSGGRTLGTMNLLHERDYYGVEDLKIASCIAGLLVVPLLTRNG